MTSPELAPHLPPEFVSALESALELLEPHAESARCTRCGQEYPRDQLSPAPDGKLRCTPDGPNYDQCMASWTSA